MELASHPRGAQEDHMDLTPIREALPRLLSPLKVLKAGVQKGTIGIVAEIETPSGKKQKIMIETKEGN